MRERLKNRVVGLGGEWNIKGLLVTGDKQP